MIIEQPARRTPKPKATLRLAIPRGGWPKFPVGPKSDRAHLAQKIWDETERLNRRSSIPEWKRSISFLEQEIFAISVTLLSWLRNNNASPTLADERARAADIRKQALSLRNKLKKIAVPGVAIQKAYHLGEGFPDERVALPSASITGMPDERVALPSAAMTAMALVWPSWRERLHPLDALAKMMDAYVIWIGREHKQAKGNLDERKNLDPRRQFTDLCAVLMLEWLGSSSVPISEEGRLLTLVEAIWSHATGVSADGFNLGHFAKLSARQARRSPR